MDLKSCPSNHNHTKLIIALWLMIIISFGICFFPTFVWLNDKYSSADSYYSHGYLVPIIVGYMIYMNRNNIMKIRLGNNYWGLGLIVLALAIHVLGVMGKINFISSFSMILYISGCIWFLLGSAIIKIVAYPFAFLIFMCPVPDAFIDVVALPMKSYATSIALSIINAVGIPYMREGFRIVLSDSVYYVGTPCNGMRSLISLLAITMLLCYFLRTGLLKKILLIIFIFPLSILLNGARIAVLLVIAYVYGIKWVAPDSVFHDGSGFLVFILGLGLIFLISRHINEKRSS